MIGIDSIILNNSSSLLLSNGGSYFQFSELYQIREDAEKALLACFKEFFKGAVLKLNYTDETQWHLGISPKSLADLSPDEGRDLVLEMLGNSVLDFIFAPDSDKEDVSIHRQKLPPFLPKDADKGIHITIGMNDSYLKKEGKTPRNFHNLSEMSLNTLESLKKGIVLDESPFEIQKFGFVFGNESNMQECDGRTMFIGLLSEHCNQIVDGLKDKYLQNTGSQSGISHITLAYISKKTSNDGLFAHDAWNEEFCPMSSDKNLDSFYTNTQFKFHTPLPFLVKDLFNKITSKEEASELKTDLANYWKK